MSHRVLFFCEMFSNFVVLNGLFMQPHSRHRKCFRSPYKEIWQFQKAIGQRTTPISCIYAIGVSLHQCIAVYRCGAIVSFIIARFCQNLFVDERNQLHTFFFIIIHLGVEWFLSKVCLWNTLNIKPQTCSNICVVVRGDFLYLHQLIIGKMEVTMEVVLTNYKS